MKNKPYYFVYLIQSERGGIYTGITCDMERRMSEHKNGTGARYLKMFGFGKLLFYMKVKNRSVASIIERNIKKLKKEAKIEYIKNNRDKNLLVT